MNEGRELWKEYCGFLDKSFSEQVEYNEKKKEEHFEKWKNTKMAKHICPEGVTKFEDIPITTYKDYPILHEFGKKMEELEKIVPRKKGERLWDYYDRIGKQAAPMLDGWMTDRFGFYIKTSGTGGESKWFAHGEGFLRNFTKYTIAYVIIGCSDNWGDTKIRKSDRILPMMAPAPYGSGWGARIFDSFWGCVPPSQIMENITNMRKKMDMVTKIITRSEKIAYIVALPSTLYLISQYLTARAKFFKDKYESMRPGMGKLVLYLKYRQSKLKPSKYKRVSEIVSLKGIGIGGMGYGLYLDFLKEQYGVDPCNIYVNSEAGVMMVGSLKYKNHFIPLLENNYLEFMARDGEIKKITEIEKGNVYTPIVTPFYSMLIKCNSGDMFRVVDFEQNGLPILSFVSRVTSSINIYGYLYLSEAFAGEILTKAGLKATETWVMAKLTEPSEHILLLMEKEWNYSEEQASRVIFNILKETSEDFRKLIRDFKIEQPTKFIEVEYLPRGAFMRYFMKRVEEGVPYGQMKPLKLINPEKMEIIDILRKV
jgi:hypothetical protein